MHWFTTKRITGFISLLIVLTLMAILLPACGSNDNNVDGDFDLETSEDGDEDIATDGDDEAVDGDDSEANEDSDVDDNTFSPDTFPLSVNTDNNQILLLKNDSTDLLVFPLDGIQFGLVDEVKDNYNYDPWPLVIENPAYGTDASLRWVSVTSFEVTEENSSGVTIALTFEEDVKANLTVALNYIGSYSLKLTPDNSADKIAMYRLRPTVGQAEAFYGLGEYFDAVNHRGKKRAMQLEADDTMESNYNEAHVPIPFIIGTNGWGLFVECPYAGVFEVADADVGDDKLQITFGNGVYSSEGLTFHIFADEKPLDMTKHYYEITGYPSIPAPWALGPWIWRDEVNGNNLPFQDQELVEYDLNSIRTHDLATSGYWIDRPYAGGVNSFDFHATMFPEPQNMIDLAHDLGFRMALWHTPYVSNDHESSDRTKEIYQQAVDNNYFPPTTSISLNKWSSPIDFTNPDAFDWWKDLLKNYADMGIEGYKLDYAEDVVGGFLHVRTAWEFFDGSDERSMQSRYQYFYHKAYAESLVEDNYFLICRAGTYGDQVHANVIWPGDLDGNMALHGDMHEDCDGKACVGGMPASMIAGLTLGPSGYPFYGADTAGYRHTPIDKETFMRWFEQTALSTIMQVGGGSNDVPWEYDGDNGFDDEVLNTYRIFARLHMRLFPYQWTYAQNIKNDGRPIQRSLGLVYPELNEHPWDQYLFGDDLLVAPVVEQGATDRDVIFPDGKWISWWTGDIVVGPKTENVSAPLDFLPLYLKQSGIVPLLRPTIDTTAPVAVAEEANVDSYATDAGILYPVIFPGEESSFTLFDNSEISQKAEDNTVTITSKDGTKFNQGMLFTVVGFATSKPSSVNLDENALAERADNTELDNSSDGWLFDSETNEILVKVPAGNHTVTITQ